MTSRGSRWACFARHREAVVALVHAGDRWQESALWCLGEPLRVSIRPSAAVAADRWDGRWTGQASVVDPDDRIHRVRLLWRNNRAPGWLVIVAR